MYIVTYIHTHTQEGLLTLGGGHGGEGGGGQQAHLTQLQGVLPGERLVLDRRRRGALEEAARGLGAVEVT